MFIRVAYDPGPDHQQRLHQTDMELSGKWSDDEALRYALQNAPGTVRGVAVWESDDWRTIDGALPCFTN
jgi:hypothetical protein